MSYPNITNKIDTLEEKHDTELSNIEVQVSNNINDIQELLNEVNTIKQTYLPLSGGTMTGNIIPYQFVVGENEDLNNCTEPGEYICSLTATAKTISNIPHPEAFTMTVRKSSLLQQEWRHHNCMKVYRRTYQNWEPVGWKDWIEDIILVDSYVSGTNGYRKYSDGWIEQWGRSTTSGNAVITLSLAFSNTSYNLTVGGGNSGGVWPYGNIISTTQIQVGIRGTQSFTSPTHWYACGY